jgi:hypothetical protein
MLNTFLKVGNRLINFAADAGITDIELEAVGAATNTVRIHWGGYYLDLTAAEANDFRENVLEQLVALDLTGQKTGQKTKGMGQAT